MRLIVHRGTKEIGGSCVELATTECRILIDFGMPLVNANREPFDFKVLAGKSPEQLKRLGVLPDIKGLYRDEEKSLDVILISHSHMDHYGLLGYVHPEIPIYASEGAKILMEASNIFTPCKVGNINTRVLDKRQKLEIGNVTVIPYLVDHSAFDALAFRIEADGRKMFYSGDFRGHGRKSTLFKSIVAHPPKDIDCLLLEGSMIGRGKQVFKDETAVESRIEKILRSNDNIKFLFASAQNIDRIVSAYRACLKTGHIFVIDIYTAYILDSVKKVSKKIPQFNWRNIRVKFLKSHADTLATKVSKELLYRYNTRKIEMEEINEKKSRVLMLARDNSIFPAIVKSIKDINGARIIYSMWEGYLTEEFKNWIAQKGLEIESVHTSGHATLRDLKAFANALKPRILIPIHTFEPGQYPALFRNVRVMKDGEALDLG